MFDNITGIAPLLTVKVNDPDMGEVTIEQEADCDQPAIIRGTANEGYTFVQWNDGNTDNPRTVDVTEDMTLTAEFAPKESGIGSVNQQLMVTPSHNSIEVSGAAGKPLSVYNVQGQSIYQGTADALTVVTVPATGLYVVVVGDELVKVMVRQ